jgi:hypothetical protein
MFDDLEALSAPKPSDLHGEIDQYLATNIKDVCDAIMWWTERKSMYLALSQIALDHLTIPGESHHIVSFCTYS